MSLDLKTNCRTCMNTADGKYQLYDCIEEYDNRILDMLQHLVPQMQIKEEKQMDFSTLICSACVDKLLIGYKFQELCIQTDNLLRHHWTNVKDREEEDTEPNEFLIPEVVIKCEYNSEHEDEDGHIDNSEEVITPQIVEQQDFGENEEADWWDNRDENGDCNSSNETEDRSNNTSERKNSKPRKHCGTYLRVERKIKPSCLAACKLQCGTKLNEEDRNRIFSAFWSLGNIEKQRQYIADNIEAIKPKYRYVNTASNKKPRMFNNAYYFSLSLKKVRVCKLFFMNTLDINDRNIRNVVAKKYPSEITNLKEDKRGKSGNWLEPTEAAKNVIRRHIKAMLKCEERRLSQMNGRKPVIYRNRTIYDLHQDYVAKCELKNIKNTNYATYYKIFKEEFNSSSVPNTKRNRIPTSVVNNN